MTKGISDMLGIPHLDELVGEDVDWKGDPIIDEDEEDYPVDKANVDLLTSLQENLQVAEGTDHAKAMDELHRETLEHSRNIVDLAFNVDDKSRRGLLEQAANFYKVALDAKNSKRDAQLKAIKLMQDQQKLNLDERKFRRDAGESVSEPGTIETEASLSIDRNVLIQQIRDEVKAEQERESDEDAD